MRRVFALLAVAGLFVTWAPSSSAQGAPEFECNPSPGHSQGPQAGPLQIPPQEPPPSVIIRACP
jgi:hypothetical protein